VTEPMRLSKTLRAVMQVLADAEQPLTGYELHERTGKGPGTIYPALDLLEFELDWVEGQWVPDERRPGENKRVYTTTEADVEEYYKQLLVNAEWKAARRERSLIRRWLAK
jgi:DNA-binding PadR family transcriptional regulator